MVTEIAILNIIPGMEPAFLASFDKAKNIISSMKGYLQHELLKSVAETDKYILIVRWQTLEDHTEGFRKSAAYQEWKQLLHHFYDPFRLWSTIKEPIKQHDRQGDHKYSRSI